MLARDLVREALAALLQRPSRTALTAAGVTVGIASLVATVGLASTAGAQISTDFDALLATQVGVSGTGNTAPAFPNDAERRMDAMPGVRAAGIWYVVDANAAVAASRSALTVNDVARARLVAASPGYLAAEQVAVTGHALDQVSENIGSPVAVAGSAVLVRLGIQSADLPAAVLVNGRVVTVIGELVRSPVQPALLNSIVVCDSAAHASWGTMGADSETMAVLTAPGAAQQVAQEAPLVLLPEAPTQLVGLAPPSPVSLRDKVQGNVSVLFLGLAAVSLLVGGLGIANMTLVSVLERTSEIGLRRAVGGTRRQLVLQFMFESGFTGLLGGLVGSCLGLVATVAVAAVQTWTLTIPADLPMLAPLLGLIIGVLAGAYPSWRAGSIQPIAALRR